MKYKHIVWDWNGTLLDDLRLTHSIMNGILKDNSLPGISLQEYREVFGFPVKEYYKKLGLDRVNRSFEDLSLDFISEYEARKGEAGLFSGAEELLGLIKNAGCGQSLLSAYRQRDLVRILGQFRLGKYFDHVSGLSDIYASSKVENGLRLIETIGIPSEEVLVIGDTVHDYDVSRAIGASACLLSCGHQSYGRLRSSGAEVLKDFQELKKFILK